MIRALIFHPDVELARSLRQVLAATGHVDLVGLYHEYPNFSQLERMLQVHRPQAIFASTAALERCAGVAANARLLSPSVPVIAAGEAPAPDDLMCLFDSGVREFIGVPFEPSLVQTCIDRVTLQSEHGDTGRHSRHFHGALAGA